jgi:hypothetical protein
MNCISHIIYKSFLHFNSLFLQVFDGLFLHVFAGETRRQLFELFGLVVFNLSLNMRLAELDWKCVQIRFFGKLFFKVLQSLLEVFSEDCEVVEFGIGDEQPIQYLEDRVQENMRFVSILNHNAV